MRGLIALKRLFSEIWRISERSRILLFACAGLRLLSPFLRDFGERGRRFRACPHRSGEGSVEQPYDVTRFEPGERRLDPWRNSLYAGGHYLFVLLLFLRSLLAQFSEGLVKRGWTRGRRGSASPGSSFRRLGSCDEATRQ